MAHMSIGQDPHKLTYGIYRSSDATDQAHSQYISGLPQSNHPAAVAQGGARAVEPSSLPLAPLADQLRTSDLDLMAQVLLPKLSREFQDSVLAMRFETIGAQQLVNLLGRAERLGYDVRDVVTGNESGPPRQEIVIPTANPIPAPPAAAIPPSSQPQPRAPYYLPSDEQVRRLGIAFCTNCNRACGGERAVRIHMKSGLCGSAPVPLSSFGKNYCIFCGQKFTGNAGLQYHKANNVCGVHTPEHSEVLTAFFVGAEQWRKNEPAPASAPISQTPFSQTPFSQTPVSQTPVSQAPVRRYPETKWATPVTPALGPARTPQPQETPSSLSKDPYAALSPAQRLELDTALARVEKQYAEGMKNALALAPEAQKQEMLRLKNLYYNKMSMTRKKFGIRLRERRSKSVIDSERERMLGGRGSPPITPNTPGSATAATAATVSERRGSVPTSLQTGNAVTRPMPMLIAGSYTAPIRTPADARAVSARSESAGSASSTAPVTAQRENEGNNEDEEMGEGEGEDEDEDERMGDEVVG